MRRCGIWVIADQSDCVHNSRQVRIIIIYKVIMQTNSLCLLNLMLPVLLEPHSHFSRLVSATEVSKVIVHQGASPTTPDQLVLPPPCD